MLNVAAHAPRRGPHWGLAGALCVLVLGIIGLHGLAMHCNEPVLEDAVHAVTDAVPGADPLHHGDGAPGAPASATGSDAASDGLLLCALLVSGVALLSVGFLARRSAARWRLPAPRVDLRRLLLRPLRLAASPAPVPLRC